MRVAVDFTWRDVGWIRLEAGKLRFPEVPDSPGVYRFDLGQTVYIGLDVEGSRSKLDFRHKASRLLVENAALSAARMAGAQVENL